MMAQRIYIENNAFMVNGNSIWLNGANTPWDNWNDLGGNFNYSFWNNHFAQLQKAGINNTRVWLACNGDGGINITEDGFVVGPTDAFWEDMDSLMAIAQRHQIYIMGGLISFDHTIEGNPKWQRWRNMYSSDSTMNSFVENYAVALVKRYADNPYLFSLDVCNEILWVSESEQNDRGNFKWSTLQYLVGKTAQRVHEESEVLVCVSNYIKYTSPKHNGNKWSDAVLQAQVDDEDAYVDFYKIHYYPWVYPRFDGFHAEKSPEYFGISEKPCISGEISAHGIYYQTTGGQTKKLCSEARAYEMHYKNGWQGAQAWTSNGVDSNGDLNNDLRRATLKFQQNHFNLVQQPHDAGNPADPAFFYAGRIDFSNMLTPVIYYAGSYIHTRFGGTTLKAVFSDHQSKVPLKIHFVIDSAQTITKTLELGAVKDTLTIFENLTDTIHSLYIAKVDGPGAGAFGLKFHGLILDHDTALFTPEQPKLKIEIFGDSFTEGVGSECETNGDCGKNNGWNSYGNRLARKMNAIIYNNGIGGLAVLDNTGWYQSKTTGLETTYDKLIPIIENGLNYKNWNLNNYTPDLLIFAMGVNDEYDPLETAFADTTRWKKAYKYVIQDLVNHYGEDVKIVIAPGNLNAQKAYSYSESVVNELKALGYSIWFYRYSFEVDEHPDKEEHIKMADELYEFITTKKIIEDTNKNPYIDLSTNLYPGQENNNFKNIYHTIIESNQLVTLTTTQHPLHTNVIIYNTLGEFIDKKKVTLNQEKTKIKLPALEPGMYIVSIQSNNLKIAQRIVVY